LRPEFPTSRKLAFSGKGNMQLTEEQRELARLKREMGDVKMEHAILKKP